MKIKVIYMSQIRKAAGIGEEALELNTPCTVQEFIKQNLCKRHPELEKFVLEQNGSLRSIILIFQGSIKVTEDTPRNLNDGDTITIMAPITGG